MNFVSTTKKTQKLPSLSQNVNLLFKCLTQNFNLGLPCKSSFPEAEISFHTTAVINLQFPK